MADREKSSRPFYELPAHIKPCSRIIQETRMQLKYSKKLGSEIANVPNTGGPSGDCAVGNEYFGNCELPEIESNYRDRSSPLGFGGMRPVNTQRPFTPRDSVSLWGISARKRPPSAITLSRLSIEEVDETKPSPTNVSSNPSGRLKPLVPKSSLVTLPSQISPSLLPESRSLDISLDNNTSGSYQTESNAIEKTRLKMKSLSLQNVTSSRTPGQMQPLGSDTTGIKEDADDRNKMTRKKSKLSDESSNLDESCVKAAGDGILKTNRSIIEGESVKAARKPFMSTSSSIQSKPNNFKGNQERNADPYREINNLEVAIEYLRCFVIESGTSDKPPKQDVISILKKIRDHVPDAGSIPALKKQLLQLIFKLVERNQADEDILFWASFVLLNEQEIPEQYRITHSSSSSYSSIMETSRSLKIINVNFWFQCNIMGNNLTTVFKMVFKASRSKGYKDIINDTDYLEVLMQSFAQICPKSQTDSMIYGYGTLKFICVDNIILNRVIDLNLIPIMALHLKILNCEIAEMGKIPESIYNGTFQLTSILRSVVGEERSLISVVQSGLLEELCSSLVWTVDDIDVLTNIVRILSVVSMDDTCCHIILNNDCFCESVVGILKLWYGKDDVMVRLTYCLGNLLANEDEMRIKLFEEPHAYEYILKVLTHYIEKSTPISMDILVKTTRILANWILNPSVGSEICDDPDLSELMYSILQIKDISDELVLCVMCTLNNTSFYKNYYDLDEGTMKTVEYLYKNLDMKDLDARTEAVKVLGNLTRNENVRLLATGYVDNILISLEEEPEELLCATCGILINIIVEEKVKAEFLRKKGVDSLIRLLEKKTDPAVSLMASQIVWNLIISNENQGFDSIYSIPQDAKSKLKKILTEKLQISMDDSNNTSSERDEEVPYQVISQDFHSVAQNLILKL